MSVDAPSAGQEAGDSAALTQAEPVRLSFPKRVLAALVARFGSSLTRRIVVLNLGGLLVLFISFLYLNQFREGLIEARVQSLQTQGEIIARLTAAGYRATPVTSAAEGVAALEGSMAGDEAVILLSSGNLGGLIEAVPAMCERRWPSR
jgi:hypothetical protein